MPLKYKHNISGMFSTFHMYTIWLRKSCMKPFVAAEPAMRYLLHSDEMLFWAEDYNFICLKIKYNFGVWS